MIGLYGLGNAAMTAVSRSGFGEHQATASRYASLALSLGIRDDDILSRAVTPAPGQVWAVYDFLKASGQVPFDAEPRWRVGEKIDVSVLSERPHERIRGELDRVAVLPGGYLRLGGWAFGQEVAIDEILLLDAESTLRGEVFTKIRRPELKKRVAPNVYYWDIET